MQAGTQFWQNRVMVVTVIGVRGRKTLQMQGFPVQTYGKSSKCHNFNSKVWIKILSGQISSFDPFCMPYKNYVLKCSQKLHELII